MTPPVTPRFCDARKKEVRAGAHLQTDAGAAAIKRRSEMSSDLRTHHQSKRMVCVNCRQSFAPSYGSGPRIYCSRVCRHAAAFGQKFLKTYFSQLHAISWKACVCCGRAFLVKHRPGSATCSQECGKEETRRAANDRYRAARPLALRKCRRCGTEFMPEHAGREFCSLRCNKRNHSGKHAARAKKRGQPWEPVSPVKVFERDGWTCRICGNPTPQHLIGTRDDCAPELDHTVAIGLGGPSTYANTQCTCRKCNRDKGHAESRLWNSLYG
jgi:hypothetical protein